MFFLFHSQLTHLDLGNNSHYTFCGLLFQCQFSFQRFCSTVLILPTCVPPMDQSGTWAMAYIVVYFSKPLELYFNSFSWMHSWGICSGLHTQLHQIFSSSFLLFVISLKLPGSQEPFLLVLHPKSCSFSILVLSQPPLGQIGNLGSCFSPCCRRTALRLVFPVKVRFLSQKEFRNETGRSIYLGKNMLSEGERADR